jgi:hypothetical protein
MQNKASESPASLAECQEKSAEVLAKDGGIPAKAAEVPARASGTLDKVSDLPDEGSELQDGGAGMPARLFALRKLEVGSSDAALVAREFIPGRGWPVVFRGADLTAPSPTLPR